MAPDIRFDFLALDRELLSSRLGTFVVVLACTPSKEIVMYRPLAARATIIGAILLVFSACAWAQAPNTGSVGSRVPILEVAIPLAPAAPAPDDHSVLILGTTVTGGLNCWEAQRAAAIGLTPVVVDATTWGAMTAADFASYRALVFGDPTCQPGTGAIAAAEANRNVWGPVVNGNVIIIGADPVFHAYNGALPGAITLIEKGIGFAAEVPGKTGSYVCLSCYYYDAVGGTPVPLLDPFGTFTVVGQSTGWTSCPNASHIIATSPALEGLEDADLSNWSCSVHEGFVQWPLVPPPPKGFAPLAISIDLPSTFTAPDGTVGAPYIMQRGAIAPGYLCLAPADTSLAVGHEYQICAFVSDSNDCNGEPFVGTTVHFEVTSGPDSGRVGTALTDNTGHACWGFTGTAEGLDGIRAWFQEDGIEGYNTATVTWTKDTVIEPVCEGLPARVTDITPELDLKSRGEWIGFKVGPPLELPCYASNDMRDSFRLNDVLLSDGPARVDYDAEWGQNVYFVKFKRAAVEALFPGGGMQVVKISGLCEGVKVPVSSSIATPTGVACVTTPFCGTDTLWLIEPEVQNPTAGQIVSAGSDLPISWDLPAGQEADEAAIHYSLDAGATWTTVVEHYTGSTSYTWRVPVVGTDSVVVAVESYRNGTLAGQGLSPMFQISNSTAGVTSGIPTKVYLSLPQPSPFGSSTVMRYGLPKAGTVKLSVVDITGRVVRTLVNGMQAPGIQTATWNGQDDHGRRVEAGVYLYRFEGLGVVLSQKVVYLR